MQFMINNIFYILPLSSQFYNIYFNFFGTAFSQKITSTMLVDYFSNNVIVNETLIGHVLMT